MVKLLVVNAGSSSLRYKIFDEKTLRTLYRGHVERVKNHTEAVSGMLDELIGTGTLKSKADIRSVGHRVVHGGETYTQPTIVTKKVLKDLEKLSHLAPLHNPANIHGIEACQKLMPEAKHIAVFDTAFHSTIPERAYRYAVPQEWLKKYGIRRYGFHGTSHKYVAEEARAALGASKCDKLVTCHLGNGCSVTAIHKGKSIDTSMGFTPLEGLPMGTRSGSIDPAIVFHLIKHARLNHEKIEDILEHKSGFKALSGYSDMRDIWRNAKRATGDKALLTLDIFGYRTAQYIGSYAASLNGLDAIVFTAGIGENAWYIRQEICEHLTYLGIKLDARKNRNATHDRKPFAVPQPIHAQRSKVKILVIPTNEELQIAREIAQTTRQCAIFSEPKDR